MLGKLIQFHLVLWVLSERSGHELPERSHLLSSWGYDKDQRISCSSFAAHRTSEFNGDLKSDKLEAGHGFQVLLFFAKENKCHFPFFFFFFLTETQAIVRKLSRDPDSENSWEKWGIFFKAHELRINVVIQCAGCFN